MCERFALHSDMASIRARFRVQTKPAGEWTPRWNLAHGDEIPIIRRGKNGRREITGLKWGLAFNHPLLECENGPATSIAARSLKRSAAFCRSMRFTSRPLMPRRRALGPSHLMRNYLWASPPSGRLPPKGADRGASRSSNPAPMNPLRSWTTPCPRSCSPNMSVSG